jgi:hypothetical protein
MTPDINVIRAARRVLGDALRTNEDFRKVLVSIVVRRLPEHPKKDELALEILEELLK